MQEMTLNHYAGDVGREKCSVDGRLLKGKNKRYLENIARRKIE